MERVRIKVYGMVQGVFFRAHTQEEAARLGLTGYVKNTIDGGVEAVAEGDRETLQKLVAWCRHGPPAAKVDSINVEWLKATGEYSNFRIRY
jgi:acylphosphatase